MRKYVGLAVIGAILFTITFTHDEAEARRRRRNPRPTPTPTATPRPTATPVATPRPSATPLPTPQPTPVAGNCPQIVIAAYFYPGALWDRMAAAGRKIGTVIMNPASGPGNAIDQNYVAAVAKVRAAGIRVIGYVHTSYGARDMATMKAEVDAYKSRYKVDGIFFDEASDQASRVPYYQELANYVRSTTGTYVMLNPGVYPNEGYIAIADSHMVFENFYSVYLSSNPPSYVTKYPASKFVHLAHETQDAAQMANGFVLAKQRNAGQVFFTSDTLPNPYDTLPPYWDQEVAQACAK